LKLTKLIADKQYFESLEENQKLTLYHYFFSAIYYFIWHASRKE